MSYRSKSAEETAASLTKMAWGLGALVVLIVGIPLHAYVTLRMWQWYVVPLGAPVITLWHALMLRVTLRYAVVYRYGAADMESREKWSPSKQFGMTLANSIFGPLLVLLIGWLFSTSI